MVTRTSARKLGSLCGAAALVATLAFGCVVSPQPSPPAAPILDGDGIRLGPTTMSLEPEVFFEGAPGTVDPPRGVVVVTNLETTAPPSLAEVLADGSFSVALTGVAGDSFRFQLKQGAERSQPVDLTVTASPPDITATEINPTCLEIEPRAWISFDAADDVREAVVRNTCDGEVTIGAPRLRRGLAAFNVTPAAPVVVPPGGSTRLTVRGGAGGEEREDVLFLDITGSAVTRRALTLTLPD